MLKKSNYTFSTRHKLLCIAVGWNWCVLASCSLGVKDRIRDISNYDATVVPLVDSYELIKLNGLDEWTLNLKNKPGSIKNIDSIGLVMHTILVHSPKTYARDTMEMASWFVLDATTHTERQFESRTAYKHYLAAQKISNDSVSMDEVAHFTRVVKPIH